MYIIRNYAFRLLLISAILLLTTCTDSDNPTAVIFPDYQPPLVTWLAPEPGSEVQDTVIIEFSVSENDTLESVGVFLDGMKLPAANLQTLNNTLFTYGWNTLETDDGRHELIAAATDLSGNFGMSIPMTLTVLNHPDLPRVIYVPDDYVTIQGAINASEDGDTVRVRAGIYYEGIRLIGKSIWIESEEGPEVTKINATGWAHGIYSSREVEVTIRGFWIDSCEYTGISGELGSFTIYNCIITGDKVIDGIWIRSGEVRLYNCVVDNANDGIHIHYCLGIVFNSIMVDCNLGYREQVGYNNWIDYGWNLFWRNEKDYQGAEPQPNDIFENPQFEENSYRLHEISPAINAGKPDILDRDGSRSDIGVYGGPYAYKIPLNY